jgi:glucose-6-phosphate isomerase
MQDQTTDLCLDFTNVLAKDAQDPHGLPWDVVQEKAQLYGQCVDGVEAKRATHPLGFLDLPGNAAMVEQILELKETWRGRFDNFLQVGIGGSALGAMAVFEALAHPLHNDLSAEERNGSPRMYFADNIDPQLMAGLADVLDVEKTLFHVVSLSGGTAETIAGLLLFAEPLKKAMGDAYGGNMVISSAPDKGDLQQLARDEGITLTPIPPRVGGRFSVLTPQGLVAAALLDVDIPALLAGAQAMIDRCATADPMKNPAFVFALLHHLADRMRDIRISVLWSYSHALRRVGDWYCQLIGESIGKHDAAGAEVGITPVQAVGVTDQHSQLQLYAQGPRDKLITFLTVDDLQTDCEFPAAYKGYKSVDYLVGQTVGQLFHAERKGTEAALTAGGRLNCRLSLPTINAYTLGQLFMFFEIGTCYLGELYGVNAFDQPGVEDSKNLARALMGKPGDETLREQLEAQFNRADRHVV